MISSQRVRVPARGPPNIYIYICSWEWSPVSGRSPPVHHPKPTRGSDSTLCYAIMRKGPKPYKLIGFGDIHGPKAYKFIGFGEGSLAGFVGVRF